MFESLVERRVTSRTIYDKSWSHFIPAVAKICAQRDTPVDLWKGIVKNFRTSRTPVAFTFAIRSKRNVSMRAFYASGILTRRGFAAWKSWTNIFRNSVPSFRCWTLHAFVRTLDSFVILFTLHETKERRCCVFSDRWFVSWRWLWPWRMFDERKSFVSGQISIRLRNSFRYRLKFFRIESNVIILISPGEERKEEFRILNEIGIAIIFILAVYAGKKEIFVNETCMQNVWMEKCSEGRQRLTGKNVDNEPVVCDDHSLSIVQSCQEIVRWDFDFCAIVDFSSLFLLHTSMVKTVGYNWIERPISTIVFNAEKRLMHLLFFIEESNLL